MTGCENLWRDQTILWQEASTSGAEVAEQPTFSFPNSLQRLFLKDCNLECSNYFPLSFGVQPSLQYLNLGNGLFEFLPCYNHLRTLRVLDLSLCSRLKCLLDLPNTLAELYVYYCKSLERITFESSRFTLLEFGYEGCTSLSEIEGFIKLIPVAKHEENDLGHMKWLKEYQNHEVCLVGDDELTKGRSSHVQMLYEFDIISTSLPDIMDPNVKPEYVSEFSSLSFNVPLHPKNRRLKGLDVRFRYRISGDDCAWFCKISRTNCVDLLYNPKVFGKPDSGKVGVWLSFWPIGNTLNTGDQVNVSIVVLSGLDVHKCGVSLVYADDELAKETLDQNTGWIEIFGGDLSGFQLTTGAYYLCRRDFFELMEFGRLTSDWFRSLVGDTIDVTEVRGWRKTGRPKQLNPSFTELKTVRCIIYGPELEEIYNIAEMSKSSSQDNTLELTSSALEETTKSASSSKFSDIISVDSGSSSGIKASPGGDSSSYDVFVSFRGEDTRPSFTDHLYDALKRAGISAFRDNQDINTGEELKPEIERVIRESRASIVVLSENYATSTRCLDELVLILQQMRECNHYVLPVFYHVNPSDVRKQKRNFAIEVKASSRWTDRNVKLWKEALMEVANVRGMRFSGLETELKKLVDEVYKKLSFSSSWGIGGFGKTWSGSYKFRG